MFPKFSASDSNTDSGSSQPPIQLLDPGLVPLDDGREMVNRRDNSFWPLLIKLDDLFAIEHESTLSVDINFVWLRYRH